MSVTSMNSRMAMAEKLSIPQLQQAIKAGTVPAYVGIPLLQEKVKMQRAMQAQMQQAPQPEGTIADQVMREAEMEGGIDQLPSNLPVYGEEEMGSMGTPEYARGGIVALAEGGDAEDEYDVEGSSGSPSTSTVDDDLTPEQKQALGMAGIPEWLARPGTSLKRWWREQYAQSPKGIQEAAAAGQGAPETIGPQGMPSAAPPAPPMYTGESEAGYASVPAPTPEVAPAARPPAPTRSAAPQTLKAAERVADSDSPQSEQANKTLSLLDQYVAQLEKSGESVDRDKKEALYMALIQGGLAAAGGTSPNALANIAAGMVPAMQGYQQALAGIKKDERARLEKLMAAGISKEKLGLELRKLGIEEKKAEAMANYYNARAATAGTGASDKLSAAEQRQLRLLAFKAGQDLNRVEADVAKTFNSEEYKKADETIRLLSAAKNPSPVMQKQLQAAQETKARIRDEANRRLADARSTAAFYRKEAGWEEPTPTPSGGGGAGGGFQPGKTYVDKQGNKAVYRGKDASGKDIWE